MISIIIPVYNLEKYIRYCVESVLSSEYSDIEIILVDDGSTDNSGIICDEYEKKYRNIKTVHSDNKGVSAARNIGIDISKGEYLFFLDGDDIIYPKTFSVLLEGIKKQTIYSSCGFKRISEYNEYVDTNDGREFQKKTNEEIVDLLSEKIRCGVWGILFRRDMIGELRFVEGKVDNEDKFFRFQYLMNNEGVIMETTKPLYGHYNRKGSLSNSTEYNEQVYLSVLYYAEQITKETSKKGKEIEHIGKYNEMVTYLHILKYIIRKNAFRNRYSNYMEVKGKLLKYKTMDRKFFKNHFIEYNVALLSDTAYRLLVFVHDILFKNRSK